MKKFLLTLSLILTIIFIVSCSGNGYLVKFDSNGAGNVPSQSIAENGLVEKPVDPVKEGYTFLGWYLEDELYDFKSPVTTRFELVAKWEINTYSVKFVVTGEETVEEVQHGNMVTKPADPQKEGHTFAGWYVGDEPFNFEAAVTSDVVVEAKFDLITNVVAFDIEGIESQEIAYGDVVVKPADPEKEGYEFVGWYLDGALYDFTTPVVSSFTLNAKWIGKLNAEDVIGSWSGVESMYGMELATFEFSFNADGSGKASYSMSGYNMSMEVTNYTVENNILVINYVNNGNANSVRFESVDGKLVGGGINGGGYSEITLAPKAINVEDVAGTWVGAESYSGVEMPYTVVINADGTVTGSIDMFGSVMELTFVEMTNKLVFDNYGMKTVFVFDGTQFAGAGTMGGNVVLSKKAADITVESLAGSWAGVEVTAYGNYNYVIKLASDGTGTGSYADDAGLYPADITIKSTTVNNASVVMVVETYGMEYTIEFNYQDGQLVSAQGLMWGTLTINKTISLEDVAGTWVGSEEFYGMVFEYEFVINADGTGSAKYTTSYSPTIMTVESYAIVSGKIVLTYNVDGYEYDPITLEFVDGTLTGVGPMGTVITLTKSEGNEEPQFSIEGTWTGVEVTAYGNYNYQIVLNADGTGTGSYADDAGLYPADITVLSTQVNGSAVVMVVETYGMEYTVEFTIEDGKLVSAQGLMWGALTLSK